MKTEKTYKVVVNEVVFDSNFTPGPELHVEMSIGHEGKLVTYRQVIPIMYVEYYRGKSEEYAKSYLRAKKARMFENLLAELEAP